MAPRICERKLVAGAWGITVANVRQAEVAASVAPRILIANEVIRTADLEWIGERAADSGPASVLFCMDSPDGVELAARAATRYGTLQMLVEYGYPGGRGGARDHRQLSTLASQVEREPSLTLAGLMAYEGLIDVERGRSRKGGSLPARYVRGCTAHHFSGGGHPAGRHRRRKRVPRSRRGRAWAAGLALGWSLMARSGCYVTHDPRRLRARRTRHDAGVSAGDHDSWNGRLPTRAAACDRRCGQARPGR